MVVRSTIDSGPNIISSGRFFLEAYLAMGASNMLHRRYLLLALLSSVLLQFGCSGDDRPKMAKVTGVVTYKGAPVAGATINFVSETAPRGATGVTDDKGQYQLTTFDNNDGAVLGDHKVTIFKADPAAKDDSKKQSEVSTEGGGANAGSIKVTTTLPGAGPGKGPMPNMKPADPKSLLPVKYAQPTKSGLTAKVVEGKENKFDFTLTD
jgi:hypothetical protein